MLLIWNFVLHFLILGYKNCTLYTLLTVKQFDHYRDFDKNFSFLMFINKIYPCKYFFHLKEQVM
jgi:hypothetical protein